MKKTSIVVLAAFLAACSPAQQEQKPAEPDDKTTQGDDPVTPGNSTDPSAGSPDFTPEPWYETNFWERSDREKMGLRGPVKKITWGTPNYVRYYIMEFNGAGNLIYNKEVFYDTQSGFLYRYYYDDENRLIKKEFSSGVPADAYDFDYPSDSETPFDIVWNPALPTWRMTYEYKYENPGKNTLAGAYSFDLGMMFQTEPFNIRENYDVYHMICPGLSSVLQYETPNPWPENWEEPNRHEFREEIFKFDDSGNLLYGIHDYYTHVRLGTPDNPWNGEGAISGDWFEEEEIHEDYPTGWFDPFTYKDGYPYSYQNSQDAQYGVSEALWAEHGVLTKYVNPGIGTDEFSCDGRYWHPKGENFIYDKESGEPLKIIYPVGTWMRDFTYYDYVFDTHGNWISYKVDFQFLLDGPESEYHTDEYVRTIEYY